MKLFVPSLSENSGTPKYIQIVDAIDYAMQSNRLSIGDPLPSVNLLMSKCKVSRDTVFKAYSELKNRGLIESIPNKGYYVSRQVSKVFLFLDTFKAYKEVLYGAFQKALPKGYTVDLNFHHYNIRVFEDIITHSIGKYSHYVIMNFDHPDMQRIISQIDPNKLLIIDWNIHALPTHSFICQDFNHSIYNSLQPHVDILSRYNKIIYVYPEFTYHPKESIANFHQFCSDNNLNCEVLYDIDAINPKVGELYFLVSDRTLAIILDLAVERGLVIGKEIGIISYNDTPMKKYVKDGITVLSTDFKTMGQMAANYITLGEPIKHYLPSQLILRASL